MNQYFSAIQAHLEDNCDIDSTGIDNSLINNNNNSNYTLNTHNSHNKIASLGIDDMIFLKDLDSSEEKRYNLTQGHGYNAISIHPNAQKCCLAGTSNQVVEYEFATESITKLHDTLGKVSGLKYSPSGRYIAVASEQFKAILIDLQTGKMEKCRPGHLSNVVDVFFSWDEKYLVSLGKDQNALVCKLQQLQQVSRVKMTHMKECSGLKGSFHISRPIVYLPGQKQLQKLELVSTKWQLSRMESVCQPSQILIAQMVKEHLVALSCAESTSVWNVYTGEKMVEVQSLSFSRIVPTHRSFCGVNDTGRVYIYKRQLREYIPQVESMQQNQEKMDIEEQEKQEDGENQRIEFQERNDQDDGLEQKAREEEIRYIKSKKSKADKIVTCYPQPILNTATEFNENSRFLLVNHYGCIIERRQQDQAKKSVQVEYKTEKGIKRSVLLENKEITCADMNAFMVLYANQNQFGVKFNNDNSGAGPWTRRWRDVAAVALGSNWLAVANEEEVKILDLCGHEIRTISFDRQMVAMRAYQNILVLVYHQSIPLQGNQCLYMGIYNISGHYTINGNTMNNTNSKHFNSNLNATATAQSTTKLLSTQVPITPKSVLRYINFSLEGMLFSQDSAGQLRAYSLETGDWTPLLVKQVEDTRRLWLFGVSKYQLQYHKTTDLEPEPTVSPRLPTKGSELIMSTLSYYYDPKQENREWQQLYPTLLWKRFILDHQKARNRLWGRHKQSRSETSCYYSQSDSILSYQEIVRRHHQLDQKYFPIVEGFLKSNQPQKAVAIIKSSIRSMQYGRALIELFDDYKMRSEGGVQLQSHFDQLQKEIQYQQMQIYKFSKLKEQAERTIKPRSENPMRRGANKKMESIPSLSQNFSQDSFDLVSQKSYRSKQESSGLSNNKQTRENIQRQSNLNQQVNNLNQTINNIHNNMNNSSLNQDNPFLKKKSTHQSLQNKKREIEDQVQKFGIRKKAEDKQNVGNNNNGNANGLHNNKVKK